MNFFTKLERKFGRYAISGLTKYIIIAYVIGYVLSVFSPSLLGYLVLEPAYILRGQIWRLVTWVVVPPSALNLFTIIMLMFYYSLGSTLERTWGYFRYNVFIFGGMLWTILGAFLIYAIGWIAGGVELVGIGYLFSTYYICLSIFMGFAATYPEMKVLIYFIIPMKVKWLSAVYLATIIWLFIHTSWAGRIAIGASVVNFLVFFLITRNTFRVSPQTIKRRVEFNKSVAKARPAMNEPRHRCAVCGKTDLDDPDMEFRYCSKCGGNYEYCMDHLFTHEHVK